MDSAQNRLPRLLALVPYLMARPGILVADAAADFGITEKQLRRDLELLWMCGLPGYGPGDLIDISFEGETITVAFDAGMRRPLRLTAEEATALLVALRAVGETPGVADTDAVQRALAKVESAVGNAKPAGVAVGLAGRENQATAEMREPIQDALHRGVAIRIRYYTVSRDEITERVVDPMRLLLVDGRSYLEAWCRRAEGVRLFRLDRVDEVTALDERAAPPPHARPTDLSEGVFRSREGQGTAVLLLDPDARWIAEYYPVEDVTDLPDGRMRIVMRYGDESWMVRLLLGQGGRVRVEEPASLARLVAERAATALRRADALEARV
ncbi:helix-turn-helix transcriptional regulator [Allokutzneria albata]|uniref:Proteasome accessory factor C n=1 Tax=Allokutzneria albata TaxID=211114 RepID=A0A1G9RCR2_ALLAB|nr:YafY family protein [Allokutzneria albata]SDM20657.1 proteasome accessory factor C [Allokutzneria albata]